MSLIAAIVPTLEAASEKYSVEALSDALKPSCVQEALRKCGREGQRNRRLPADFTLWAVVLLALFRRESCINLLFKLRESLWALRKWAAHAPPTSSAFSQARDRLGVEPLQAAYEASVQDWMKETQGVEIAGCRVMGIDGSTARVADSVANRAHFGLPGSSRGRAAYPLMRILTLFDVGTRLTVALGHAPYATGEMTLAHAMVPSVPQDSIVVLDRNFIAYELLHDLGQRGAHFIVRVKRNTKVKVVKRFGPGDALVRVRLHAALRRRRPDLPKTLLLREVIYCPKMGHEAIRVFTSLIDPATAPVQEIARGYGLRWQQEVGFDEVKTHLAERTTTNRPVLFRSLAPARVVQELYGLFIAHNLVRILIHRAAARAGVDPLRVSFVAALERVREAVTAMMVLPTLRLIDRYERMIEAIALILVPLRPGRSVPREVKIKVSSYPCKKTRRAA